MSRPSSTFRGSSMLGAIGLAALLWGAGKSFLGLPNDPDHGLFVLCCFGFGIVAEPIERLAAHLGAATYVGMKIKAAPTPEPAPAPFPRHCPRCATPARPGWGMCPECHTALDGA